MEKGNKMIEIGNNNKIKREYIFNGEDRIIWIDSGFYYSPYIPLKFTGVPSEWHSLEYIGKCYEKEKKDYEEFFKRKKDDLIIYRSKRGIDYIGKLIEFKDEKLGIIKLEFINRNGKNTIKDNILYKDFSCIKNRIWWFK